MITLPKLKKGLLIAGGAVVLLAATFLMLDTTVPGSALYGGKRAVESVRDVFIFTDKGKAQFNIMLASERMSEAEVLVGNEDYSRAKEVLEEEKDLRDLSLKYAVAITDREIFDKILEESEDLRLKAVELNDLIDDNELTES